MRRLQEQGAPIRISYPCAVTGPNDPSLSAANDGVRAHARELGIITSTGIQVVDVRDLAMPHLRLLDLPDGQHRYAAAGEMLTWSDYFDLLDGLVGHRIRRVRVPGGLLRAAGAAGDALKRFCDFGFPLTRDMMEFMTRWPGADAGRISAEHVGRLADTALTP